MGEKDHSEQDRPERPKVKVTDRRRVREREGGPDEAGSPSPAVADEPEKGKAEIEAARRETAEYRDHLIRLQAEFENYRKRVLREQTQAIEMAAEPLIRKLLEVLDEFELALMAAEQKPDFAKFLRGVELVYAKLVDTLHSEGLEPIEAEGKPFDPELHEALMGSGAGDGDPVVADVLRRGYVLRGRVIRPAGVRVTHER
ncbi:MAG: nucleotide exchange factor GrpE [Actinomycetota bacterium]